jgi:hypothetical protein
LAGVGVYHGIPKSDLFRGEQDINNRYYYSINTINGQMMKVI